MRVSLRQGVESKLLRDGAAFDVLGLGGWGIARDTRRAVLRAYSRDGFGAQLAQSLRAAARTAPGSRIGVYCRSFDFAGRAERVRFPEESAA